MTLNIPYSFTPGTKAKAEEVNADFNYVLEQISNSANTALSNLSEDAEKHFLNKSQITNCILEASNGVAVYSENSNEITVKSGIKVLIPNGRNDDGSLKNIELTSEQIVFNNTNNNVKAGFLVITSDKQILFRKFLGNFENAPSAVLNSSYYNIKDNLFYYSNDGSSWEVDTPHCHIAVFNSGDSSEITMLRTFEVVNFAQKQDLDGNWVYKFLTVIASQSLAVENVYKIDMSSYLPNDGNVYEVLIGGICHTGNTAGNTVRLCVSSDIMIGSASINIGYAVTRTNIRTGCAGSVTVIVGKERYINAVNKGNATMADCYLECVAYRKVR